MSASSYALALLAGLLTTLSPCVLPLIPIVVAGAAAAHRLGPVALAGGLTVTFVGVGLFVAVIGFSIGLDAEFFQLVAGVLMIAIGVVLLSAPLQQRFAHAGGGIANAAQALIDRMAPDGWQGQLLIGLLLGVVWVPCVGPTLGAASLMAARGENLVEVALVMTVFGLGAALPLLLIGSLSRQMLLHWRGRIMSGGKFGKMALGILLLIVGLSIATGAERMVQEWLIGLSPDWLTTLTTRY